MHDTYWWVTEQQEVKGDFYFLLDYSLKLSIHLCQIMRKKGMSTYHNFLTVPMEVNNLGFSAYRTNHIEFKWYTDNLMVFFNIELFLKCTLEINTHTMGLMAKTWPTTWVKLFFWALSIWGFGQPKSGLNSHVAYGSGWHFDHTGGYRSQRTTKIYRTAEQERKTDKPWTFLSRDPSVRRTSEWICQFLC